MVFDTVRISQTKLFFQTFGYIPGNDDIKLFDQYNSQMVGGFAEMYILFGSYIAILVFFLVGMLFSSVYNVMNFSDPYYTVLSRVLVLLFFVDGAGFLESFGFDSFVIKLISICAAVILTYYIFRSRYRINIE